MHHAFWHYADPGHPRFAGDDHAWRWVLRDYYRELDHYVGELVAELPDDALLVVVSDHGAQPLLGGIAVNEWLVRAGHLVLHEYPTKPTPPAELKIDWSRTHAWSEGGYYARVFLNVRGREPQGLIDPAEYESWRTRFTVEMEELAGPQGEALGTRVHRPEDLWRECRGVPPDLICYWGDLSYRSIGTVGNAAGRVKAAIYVEGNDSGPDEANHDWSGVFISRDPLVGQSGRVEGLRLIDISVSLLAAAGLEVPGDTAGRIALRW
jgi:predicted AlkP superfamily phosphohydrolase/phosphomutase